MKAHIQVSTAEKLANLDIPLTYQLYELGFFRGWSRVGRDAKSEYRRQAI